MNRLQITYESYNSHYKQYLAAFCRKSGLPMYSRSDFEKIQREGLYTKSRAKSENADIDTSKAVAWYRMQNGYVPLFRRKEE